MAKHSNIKNIKHTTIHKNDNNQMGGLLNNGLIPEFTLTGGGRLASDRARVGAALVSMRCLLMACNASAFSFADGERLGEETDPGKRAAGAHVPSPHKKAEDSSESREDEQMVTSFVPGFVLFLLVTY